MLILFLQRKTFVLEYILYLQDTLEFNKRSDWKRKLNWETDFQFAKVNVDFEIFLQD